MLSTKITKRVKMKKNNNNHLDFLVWAVTLVIPLVLLQCKLNLLNDIENCRRGWNLTAKFSKDHDENILIFSRVPKTASLTINAIIKKLKTINNYTAYGAIDGMPDGGEGGEYVYEPSTYMRKMLIGAVLKEKEKEKDRPFIYTRHQNFLNFTEFFPNITKVQPIYMSFVRHPVDRVISWYYYIRNPEYQFDDYGDLKTDLMKPHRLLKESIEECYYKQRRGCQIFDGMSVYSGKRDSSYISQMAFFCGHMQECDKFETKQLYNIALKNFEEHFAVVGVTEYFNISMKVLEKFLPRYFYGAQDLIAREPDILTTNKNGFKPKVSQSFKDYLAKNMTLEIDFYYQVKQRLLKQHSSLGEP